MRRFLVLALTLLLPHAAPARQDAPKPPGALASLAKSLGKKAAAPKDTSVFRFKPGTKPLFYPELAALLAQNDEQKKALMEVFVQGEKTIEELLAKDGHPHDYSAGLVVGVAISWEIATGKEPSEKGTDGFLAQLQSTLSGPEIAKLTDPEKQKIYEYGVGFGIFLKTMEELAGDDAEAKKGLKLLAAGYVEQLVGAKPEDLIWDDNGLRRKEGAAPAPSKPATGGTAPVLPALPGWQKEVQEGGTIYTRLQPTSDYPNDPLSLTILVVHAAGQTGAPEKIVREFYDKYLRPRIPANETVKGGTPLRDAMPDVCRRLVGNGMRCWFGGVSWAKKVDSLDYFGTNQEMHLYAVESGGLWYPVFVVLAGLQGNHPETKKYINPNVRYDWLEEALRSFQGVSSGKPLFTAAELAGDYEMSDSTAGPFYYNAVTGASLGMGFVSRHMKMSLKADGTYTSNYSGASGIGLATQFGSEKEAGPFRIENDAIGSFLIRKTREGKERRARLVSKVVLPDGRAMFLDLPHGYAPNLANIWQHADRYFTQKK